MTDSQKREHWVVEKKIPVAMILALFVMLVGQSFGFGWYASGQNARIAELEKSQVTIERRLEGVASQGERIVRLETKTDVLIAALTEVKELLRGRR